MNFKKSSLALAILLSMSPVVWNAGHVQAQVISEANNRGDLFREQLRNAQDGSEIQLTGDTYLLRGEGAFDINKNVTIKGNGHMLHLEGYDLSLGADVTFQNVRLSLKPSQNLDTIFGGGFEQQETLVGKIFANGHKLVLDNVDTQVNGASDNSRPMVILGSRTPETSNAGHGELNVINSGYKTKLFAVWAGGNSEQDEEQATTITLNDVSFVDSRVRKTDQGVVVGSLGDKNYTGEVNITISGTDNSLKSFDTETNTNVSLTLKSKLSGDGVLDLGVMPTLKNLTLESSDTVTVEHLNVTDTLTLKNGARLQTPPFPQESIYITVNNINAENGEIIAEEKQGRAAYVNVTGTISGDSHLKITGENVTFNNPAYTRNADNTVVLGNTTNNADGTNTDATETAPTETPPADNTGTAENTGSTSTTETTPAENTGSTGTAENTGENSGTGETNQPVNGGDSTPSEQPSNGGNGTSNGETNTDGTNANDTAETPPADNTGTSTENTGSTETQPSENTGSTGTTGTTPAENTGENSGTGETNQPVNGGDSTPSEQPTNSDNGTSNGETSTDSTNTTAPTETPPADNTGATDNTPTETQPTENTGSTGTADNAGTSTENTGSTGTTPAENTGESAGTGETNQPVNGGDSTPSEQPSNGGNGTSNGETSTDGTNTTAPTETPPADNTGANTENTGTTETQPTDNTGSTGATETTPTENTGENSGTGETNQPVNGGDSTPSEQPSNGETSTDGTNANDTAETPPADNTGTSTENTGSTETQPSENTGSTGTTGTTPAENTGENSGTGETNQPVNGGDSTPSEQPSNGGNGTSNGETSTDGTNATGSTETPPADNAGTSTENSGSTETQPTENTGSTGATETTPTENTGESAGTGEAGQSDTRPANEADTTTGSTTPTDGTSGNTTATGTNTDNTAASSGNTNNEADGNASSNDDTSPFVLQPEENVYSAVNKATYTAATTYFALYSIHQRLNGLRLHEWTKQTTDDMSLPVKQEGLWVNTKYHRIRQSHGYQLNLRGLQLGYDDVVSHGNSTLRWGVAADLEQGNTDFVDSSAQLKTKHYGVSLYGSYEMDKRHYLDMVIRAGRLSSKLNHAVESKYGQNQYSAFVAYGQSIPLADAWLLEPQVQLAYAHLTGVNHQQGDLQVNAQSVNSLVGGVGAKLAFHLTPNAEIYGKTMLHREFAGTQKWEMARTTSHNHGTYQLNNRATWGTLGLGLQAKWRDDVAVRFEFDKVMGNGHQNSHQIHFGVNWRF